MVSADKAWSMGQALLERPEVRALLIRN